MTDTTPQTDIIASRTQDLVATLPHLTDAWIKALTIGLSQMTVGQLTLILPNGEKLKFGPANVGAPAATVILHRSRAAKRILKSGDIGLGESYMDGDWTSPDVTTLIELALLNEKDLKSAMIGKWLSGFVNFLRHLRARNSRAGSRRNIAYHYDLGNSFYCRWLDETMTYSAALFTEEGQSLAEAQRQKYRRIANLAGIAENMTVLEIGCGWGGFATLAAQEYGAKVEGITLSEEQLAFSKTQSDRLGLQNQAKFHFRDYRDQKGRFDAIVSIEMFEAVGEENWDSYFSTIKRNLKAGGKAAVQVITIDEKRYRQYRNSADFIQRYIFPGGQLPSKSAFIEAAARNGLTACVREEFGGDYATTLKLWKEKFLAEWPRIEPLGFDLRFKRMWEFYLQYCEAGFRQKSIDVVIFELR
ncbi:SAM-dependent methyltransferase [Sneathiella litorea]|uniref:Methyltransferase domain-containing protein n=1 Tax=Sneathiella litorea TaxID=2606216 RepID=A0A6L8WCT0_9PROT|nr:cyclopropane-fatty-acyl-phospholipid synthase family protein [Sneathiella litorea]MZR32230.1 methyltransferase domain-containing protein [Sneathiella litorea]